MNIRRADKNDINELSLLWLSMVREEMKDACPNVEWWKKRISNMMETEVYCMFLAECENKIVGFIDYVLFDEATDSKHHAVGQQFYVMPCFRNTVASRGLWKRVLSELKNKVDVLELICFRGKEKFWRKRKFVNKLSIMQKVEVV